MLTLILGLALTLGVHALTMQRARRAALIERFGERGYKAAYSLISLIGLVLIVWGFGAYRAGGYVPVWTPPTWLAHLALLLNLPVFVLLTAAYLPGRIKAAAKHPMLLAVKIWATAHLLANGDLGSILLFGSFLAWAVLARISTKKREESVPLARDGAVASPRNDVLALAIGLAAYVAFVVWLHPLLIGVRALP
jgi:uncharacterized membrane protein